MGGKGSGGSNRKPTALKKFLGNPGKRKLNEAEPKATVGRPTMPKGLSIVAQREWKDIIPLLEQMGVLFTCDGKALAAYCSCYAQWMQAEKEITRYGITIKTVHLHEDGDVLFLDYKINPAVRVRSDALRQMKSFLIEFGLTPASRSKLKINANPDAPDALDSLFDAPANPARKPS